MKQTRLISSLLIASCLLLSGCTAPTPSSTTPSKTEAPKPIRTLLYGNFLSESIYDSKEYASDFGDVEYVDDTAPKTREIQLFDISYDAVYQTSAKRATSDLLVHIYDLYIDGIKQGSAQMHAKTGELVKVSGIEYFHSMTTEAEFVAFISNYLGDQYDLSHYDYQCKTHCHIEYLDPVPTIKSDVLEGFHIPEENQTIISYTFYYTKSIYGIPTNEHIAFEFWSDRINFEIYNFGYTEENFSELWSPKDTIEASINAYLRSNSKQGYTVHDVKKSSARLFIQDGIPYLLTTSVITYTKEGSSEQFTTLKQTITGRQ